MPTRLKQSVFIDRAKASHNNKYDYSKVIYKNGRTPIIIVCPEHGEFKQRPANHLYNRQGCPECACISIAEHASRNNILSSEEFLSKSYAEHGDRYDYSKARYQGQYIDVIIICSIHGEFKQRPNNHWNGQGCPECGKLRGIKKKTRTTKEFILRATAIHGEKYDYSQAKYKKASKKIDIICPIHGLFRQAPVYHLRGSGCPDCGIESAAERLRHDTETFILKAASVHDNYYGYSQVEYIDCKTKVKIECPIHGLFRQAPSNHLLGAGCLVCNYSLGEKEVRKALIEFGIKFEGQRRFYACQNDKTGYPLPFDFYFCLEDKYFLIEFDGRQHFKPQLAWGGEEEFREIQHRDKIKDQFAEMFGFILIRIPYTEENIKERLKYEIEKYTAKTLNKYKTYKSTSNVKKINPYEWVQGELF